MKIEANTENGSKAKIYDQNGEEITLPIKSFDTETGEVEYYELEDGKIKMTPWVPNHATGKMERKPVIVKKNLPHAYALIDGKKV